MAQRKKVALGDKAKNSINEIRLELKRVVWPTRKQLVGYTITVLVTCLIVGGIIAAFDAFWLEFLLKPLINS